MAAIREWYSGYSIIYNWFEDRYGAEALEEYWHYIAKEVYADLADQFRQGGLPYIRSYFQEIIEEDQGKVRFEEEGGSLTVEILECPDYIWQKAYLEIGGMPRENYYRSYETIYGDVAKMAGMDFALLKYDKDGRLKFRFAEREATA